MLPQPRPEADAAARARGCGHAQAGGGPGPAGGRCWNTLGAAPAPSRKELAARQHLCKPEDPLPSVWRPWGLS